MGIMERMKHVWERCLEHRWFMFSLVLALCANALLHQAFFPQKLNSDAIEYMETAQLFLGEDIAPHPHRILKPLAPLGIAAPSFFSGDVLLGMKIEVIVMYLLLGLASYALFFAMFASRLLALFGAVLMASGYPMLYYGLDLYTETGALFFYIVALLGAWKYFTEKSRPWFWVTVVAVTLGMLWKEYAVIPGIFFGLLLLFHPGLSRREKVRDVLLYGLVSIGVLVAWQWYVYVTYQYSYLDWFRVGNEADRVVREYTLYHIAKSLFATFLSGWLFAFLGVLKWKEIPPLLRTYLLFLIPPSFMFLLWGYVSSRIYYVIVPILIFFVLHAMKSWQTSAHRKLFLYGTFAVVYGGNLLWLFLSGAFRAML